MQNSYLLKDMTEFQNYRIRSIYRTCPNKRTPIFLKKSMCASAHCPFDIRVFNTRFITGCYCRCSDSYPSLVLEQYIWIGNTLSFLQQYFTSLLRQCM